MIMAARDGLALGQNLFVNDALRMFKPVEEKAFGCLRELGENALKKFTGRFARERQRNDSLHRQPTE